MENVRTSNLVSSQLPDFVRSDYPKFVTFLEKYYEWLETTNSVSYEVDALRNANDIDSSDDYYIEQLKKDLAPYFPQEIVTDKRLFLKLVTQFYKSSGTQESVKFLFRALYDENIDIYYPKEDILKASDGKWVLPLALRIDTDDNNIFNIAKTLITGQTSKATALVEKVIQSVDRQLGITYTEIYVSNVNRLFTTGERITATYVDEDTGLNVTVGGRLIGALSEIKINPLNRGLFYNAYDPDSIPSYLGDPVSIVGGLNPVANTPVGAVAHVGVTTKGGITDIIVEKGGFGFRDPAINLNSSIIDFKGGFDGVAFGTEAKATINLLDTSISRKINVSNMAVDTLDGYFSKISRVLTSVSIVGSNGYFSTTTSYSGNLTVGNAVTAYGTLTGTGTIADYSSTTLTGVVIEGSNGYFSTTSSPSTITVGDPVSISGTFTGTGTIYNYSSGTTYYIKTKNSNYFSLSESIGGAAITSLNGTTTGLTFQTGKLYYVKTQAGGPGANFFSLSATVGGAAISTTSGTTTGLTITANKETQTISSLSTFDEFPVFPISFVVVDGSGGGYRQKPSVETYSFYNEDYPDSEVCTGRTIVKGTSLINDTTPGKNLTDSFEPGDYVRLFINNKFEAIREVLYVDANNLYFSEAFPNDLTNVSVYKILRNDLYKIGSLGRITVNNGGTGYANGDILIFTGGSGYGANGYVNVSSGVITSVTINNHSSNAFVIGGEGYTRDSLPSINVQSVSGTSANLTVAQITGDGEQYGLTTSRIGAITSLRISSFGYDYVEAPTVSLRNADIVLNSVTEGQLFVPNTAIYQGTSNSSSSFSATVDSYTSATTTLRIFNYRGVFDATKTIKSDDGTVTGNVTSSLFYGDGNAKATANFENGLIRYPGIYLNTDGQISADKRLQDGEKYHNFSYIIKSQTDYSKFKKPLNDIVHPVGTKTFITKIDDNEEMLTHVNTSSFITITSLADTYNIANGSNKIITTNTSANLQATVNVGDLIILANVHRTLQNTVNVVSGSNILFGAANSVNFINDLQDGDTIYLSTGNTVSIKEVTNSSFAILDTIINVTSTSATVNLVYTATVRANSRNANTIFASSIFTSNGSNLSATIQKVR
jgi:hypothetical protein